VMNTRYGGVKHRKPYLRSVKS